MQAKVSWNVYSTTDMPNDGPTCLANNYMTT